MGLSALWDTSARVASFDFFSWLVMAKAKGATEIVFNADRMRLTNWDDQIARKRFESIILPGPALAGLPHRFGKHGEFLHGTHPRELVHWCREGNSFPRLRTVLPPRKARYTITIRNNAYIPERNSNEEAWREFGREIGAYVIDDYEIRAIHLHKRMALYAGAEMNFGMINGPMHLIVLSDYPVMMFGAHKARIPYKRCGIRKRENYPWALPNQHLIWEPDDLSTIRKHFEAWKANR